MPGGGPPPLGQGKGRRALAGLQRPISGRRTGPDWFISRCRHILLLLCRKRALGPGGTRLGEAGRGGSKPTSSSSSSFHSLFTAAMSPPPGLVTLDDHSPALGLSDAKALHATNLRLVWVGPGRKQMACL